MCIPMLSKKVYVDLVPRFFRLSHLFLLNFEIQLPTIVNLFNNYVENVMLFPQLMCKVNKYKKELNHSYISHITFTYQVSNLITMSMKFWLDISTI